MSFKQALIIVISAALLFVGVRVFLPRDDTSKQRGEAPSAFRPEGQKTGETLRTFVLEESEAARIEAASIYKEIIDNDRLSALDRAQAIHRLALLYDRTGDTEFAREHIFVGPNYAPLLEENNVGVAVRRLYETSYHLQPTALASYRIGFWYGNELAGLFDPEPTRHDYFVKLQEWKQRGDLLLAEELLTDSSQSIDALGCVYQMKALDEWVVAYLVTGRYDEVDASFDRSLGALSGEETFYTYGMGLYTRFYYAGVLALEFGEERKDEIAALIEPIVYQPAGFEDHSFLFFTFLQNAAQQPEFEEDIKLEFMIRLGELVPEFGTLLESLGIAVAV